MRVPMRVMIVVMRVSRPLISSFRSFFCKASARVKRTMPPPERAEPAGLMGFELRAVVEGHLIL